MSRVTQARGDVNQMPSMLGLLQSLKPTTGASGPPSLGPARCLPNQQKRNMQRVCFKGISSCAFFSFLFFSPNIMKKIFDKSKSLG